MSWITIIWSMTASASLTLALVHLFVWFKQRDLLANLAFSWVAISVAVYAGFELSMMFAQTPQQFGTLLRWGHVAVWSFVVSIVWFTRLYFGAGRLWLAWGICGLRSVSLVVNFMSDAGLNYLRITDLKRSVFLGETISVPVGVPNPWMLIGQATLVGLIAFFIDAAMTVWRRGDKRRAIIVGGGMIFFLAVAIVQSAVVFWGFVDAPLAVSPAYLVLLSAMGYELSRDMLRAGKLAKDLHESEERIDLAASSAGLGFWTWDVAGDRMWASDAARALIGIPASEPLDLPRFLNALHADDRGPMREAIDRSLKGSGEFEAEYRVRGTDGQSRWLAARGRIAGENGNGHGVRHLRGVMMDVTARKAAEERFRLAVEASPHAIVMVSHAGKIVLTNRQSERQFGYAREELIGMPVETLLPERFRVIHPAGQASAFTAATAEAIATGPVPELIARRKDGTEFPIEVGLNPIETDEGRFVLSAIVDISARRESETQIASLREHLSHVGRVSTMGQLASALAHEINQPLGAILRNAEAAELVLGTPTPDLEELRSIVADIRKDDHRAGDVIDRLRGLLKHRVVELRRLNVAKLLEEVAAVVRFDASERRVRVAVDVGADVPEVRGDRVHLQQVLLNLLLNAMDAANGALPEQRVVKISVRRTEDSRNVEISVTDRGHGIEPQRLTHIFEPFFSTKSQGMGMGLPISRTIIEAHGGRIWAENNADGGGATFRFTLLPAREGDTV